MGLGNWRTKNAIRNGMGSKFGKVAPYLADKDLMFL